MFIERTRAMITVDINTGTDLSPAAALKVNLAAAKDLPRQLRLRGYSGQIAIDFAPMSKRDRKPIEVALRAALRSCPVATEFVGWTPLGHGELKRKRERPVVQDVLI
jgi:Rne/Rng family ribonuclease